MEHFFWFCTIIAACRHFFCMITFANLFNFSLNWGFRWVFEMVEITTHIQVCGKCMIPSVFLLKYGSKLCFIAILRYLRNYMLFILTKSCCVARKFEQISLDFTWQMPLASKSTQLFCINFNWNLVCFFAFLSIQNGQECKYPNKEMETMVHFCVFVK